MRLTPCVFNETYEITISEGICGLAPLKETFTPLSKEGRLYWINHNGTKRKVEKRWFWNNGYFEPVDSQLF